MHSYEEYGASYLKEIAGTFAFAIYDRFKNKLVLCNDNFGFYPLFIYDCGEYIIFSTEYEPIVKYKRFDRVLDYDSIAEYFCFRFTLGNKTLFKNIKNLPPSSFLEIEGQTMVFNVYDDFNIKLDKKKDLATFAKEISKIFNKAVRIRTQNPKDFICTLSGGADTRLILSNLTKKQRKSIKFLTEHTPYVKESQDQDVIIAKMLAKKLKLKLRVGMRQSKVFGTSYFKRIRICPEKETQLFVGLHGGEFLGGYGFIMLPITVLKMSKREIAQKLKYVFSKEFLKQISNPYFALQKEYNNIKAENKELFFIIQNTCRSFFTGLYGGSRAAGWLNPYRFCERHESPYWDKDFIKFLLTIPKDFLLDYKLYNEIYETNFRELLDIPSNSDITKRKDGCMISAAGIGINEKTTRKPKYSKALKAYLKSSHTWDKNIYNEKYIKSISSQDTHQVIIQCIDFEAWYRVFASKKT